MHLIINSLDTRGWMSDEVSSRAVEKRDREDRLGGAEGKRVKRGLLQERRMEKERGERRASE